VSDPDEDGVSDPDGDGVSDTDGDGAEGESVARGIGEGRAFGDWKVEDLFEDRLPTAAPGLPWNGSPVDRSLISPTLSDPDGDGPG
jgi:hypothetical protein